MSCSQFGSEAILSHISYYSHQSSITVSSRIHLMNASSTHTEHVRIRKVDGEGEKREGGEKGGGKECIFWVTVT